MKFKMVRNGCQCLAVLTLMVLAAVPPATAQTTGASQDNTDPNISEVIVTGSRFGDRTALTSPVPVDTVPAADLRAGGNTELGQALESEVAAFSFQPVRAANTGSALRPFFYRGLPAQEVLVLVNGKRWHPTAIFGTGSVVFDFNSLPPTAVGSVQILRDGASAQYGSDAVAGVINVLLRRDTRTEFVPTVLQYYAGDGLTEELSLDSGMQLANTGFLHASAYFRDVKETNRQGYDVRQQYFAIAPNGSQAILPTVAPLTNQTPVLPTGYSFDPRENSGVNRTGNYIQGNAKRWEAGLTLNMELPLSDSITGYAYGGYTNRLVDTPFVWRRPMDDNNLRDIYPNGFEPVYQARVTDINVVGGVKGKVLGWDWDLSESWGFNNIANYANNSANISLGDLSPTNFYSGAQKTEQATTNLDVRRELNVGLAAPLQVALGTEVRFESLDITAGEPASYENGGVKILDGPHAGGLAAIAAQGIAGYTPSDAVSPSRHSIGTYVDVENQLTDQLLATVAGRYERYSDFGSTVNGKLSFMEKINSLLAFRGSASSGFRAPSLYESYFSSTGSSVINGQFYISRTFPVSDPVAVALGAVPLEPEKSVSYALGAVLTPIDSLNFTVDVYRTYLRHAIIQSSSFNDAGTRNFLTAAGYPGVGAASFFTNAIDERVDGIDLEGHWNRDLGAAGHLALSGAVNFNNPKVQSVAATPPELAAVTPIPLFNRASIVGVEHGTPRNRVNLSANWQFHQFGVFLRETRYGSVESYGSNPPFTDQVYGARWLTDLDVSYDVTPHLKVTVGAQDLFDVYPDKNNPYNNAAGLTPYAGSLSPFGFNGGFYFARVLLRY